MRIHVIGCARNASTPTLAMDPYAMISYYVTTYLHRNNHEVHYYGYEESTVECTKKWECGDSTFLSKYYVTDFEKTHWVDSHEGNRIFFNKAKDHLLINYKSDDIIICMWSPSVEILRGALPNAKIVDGNINHRLPSTFTNYHVFSSIANQHFNYGMNHAEENYWHDTVIFPMANDLDNFKFNEDKKDYFLFMARLGENKGLSIFIQLAKHFTKENFVIAGQGIIDEYLPLPSNIKFVGLLDVKKRKEYLANAKAVISPSRYAEPFGLTPIEAGLSGTPIISTDWGGYTENVIDSVTGFRCCYFNDFVNAINNIDNINPKDCRKFAERFSSETIIKDWEKYLQRINRDGWYTLD